MTKCGETSMSMLGSTTSLQDSVSPSYKAKDDRVNIIKWLQIAEVPVTINVPPTNERRKTWDGSYDELHSISLELYLSTEFVDGKKFLIFAIDYRPE